MTRPGDAGEGRESGGAEGGGAMRPRSEGDGREGAGEEGSAATGAGSAGDGREGTGEEGSAATGAAREGTGEKGPAATGAGSPDAAREDAGEESTVAASPGDEGPGGEHRGETAEDSLSHLDEQGHAHMVDVGAKRSTRRRAVAEARVSMRAETLAMIVEGRAPKGDVMATARIAGIMAAKKTADLVPLCHPISLTHVSVTLEPLTVAAGDLRAEVLIRAVCETVGQTGVEMEALTAASVAALTLYDMCKAVDRGMVVRDLMLLEKEGGASGTWTR